MNVHLQALDEEGPLKMRPVAAVHGRSSTAALVRDDSDDGPGAFDAERWRRTVAYLGVVHDLGRASDLAPL